MKTLILVNNKWVDGTPSNGDKVRYEHDGGGSSETYFYEKSKADIERDWRDSELLRTDRFAAVNDYSDPVGIAAYRQALKDYPQQPDFPNGTRPEE